MAILHGATLTPSKLELLSSHISDQPWFDTSQSQTFEILGAFRFDDPQGEVGIETHLLSAGDGPVIQIPLTYRGAPRPDADEWLITTMDHSVLGQRWVYNACSDPVYAAELVRAIFTGGTQVEQFRKTPDGLVLFEPTATVLGSGTQGTAAPTIDSPDAVLEGSDTVIRTAGLEIVVRHLLTDPSPPTGAYLSGSWAGTQTPVCVAYLR